jgi:ABC-type bacteriocin/lantibiotic exporter with double-glycine peptidase domain
VFPLFCAAVLYSYESYLSARPGETPLPTGQFLAFMATFTQFLIAMLYFSTALTSVFGIVPLYERAAPILHEMPEVVAAKSDPGPLSGAIEVNQIHFGYSSDGPLALQDVCLSVRPGQFVAIVGPSGSGKSTLLRLLLGFERPHGGSIYYNGKDLTALNLQKVRQQMGVVLQDGVLMRGPLYLNIIGSLPLTIDDAWRAARMAAVDLDIKEMPMGMHTVVSEGGRGFSGGQRQRIMIARAIARNPRFLFFDEATSALDNETQAVVNSSLECLQTTRVVVAHRLTTIRRADCIYVLDKGRVVQQGTFEELIAQEGLFREMARRQMVEPA